MVSVYVVVAVLPALPEGDTRVLHPHLLPPSSHILTRKNTSLTARIPQANSAEKKRIKANAGYSQMLLAAFGVVNVRIDVLIVPSPKRRMPTVPGQSPENDSHNKATAQHTRARSLSSLSLSLSLTPTPRPTPLVCPPQLLYLLFRVVLNFSTFGTSAALTWLFFLALAWGCYSSIMSARRISITGQVPYEYQQDVFFLTLVVQAGTLYSDYVWYLLLVIPVFIVYKGGRMLLSYVFTPDAPGPDMTDPAEIKRAAKRERKMNRTQYR
jgi:hypothetical protein